MIKKERQAVISQIGENLSLTAGTRYRFVKLRGSMDLEKFEIIVILGTSRNHSSTLKALEKNLPFPKYKIVELHKLNIQPYSYTSTPNDDFLRIAKMMTEAKVIVFATPVYWYAMSGSLKIFFDRLTELITTSKNLGRALAGKDVYLFVTGSDRELPEGFSVPFIRTSQYFNMTFRETYYFCTKN